MDQLVQVFGSLLILIGFVAAQRGALTADSRSYLLLNLVGSTIRAILAAHERQWGFLLLEAAGRSRLAGASSTAPALAPQRGSRSTR